MRQRQSVRHRAGFALPPQLRCISVAYHAETGHLLGEVVESVRALTGARWGVIVTGDEAGAPVDFVFSGFTTEERQELFAWPDSAQLFQHFRNLPGPLRVDDLSAYVRALGVAPAPMFSRTF